MTNYEEIFGNIINNSVNMVDSETDFGLGITAIAGIMSLPDDLFDIVSEQFIIELNNQLRSDENRKELLKIADTNNIKIEDIPKFLDEMYKSVDDAFKDFPENRKIFLKRIISDIFNSIVDFNDELTSSILIPIEFCNKNARMPIYAHETDAGLDIYSTEDINIRPGETILIKTGLKVAIPVGYELQVRPKSGISLKTKLRVANTPGTIDSGYRDEIGIIIENIEQPIQDISYHFDTNNKIVIDSILHGKTYSIEKGQKIAQLVLNKISKANFVLVDTVNKIEGDRGGGFGSTGLI